MRRSRILVVPFGLAALLALLALPALARAHLERPSYWPDPRPDTSVRPAAGGGVPQIRSLSSALKTKPPGATRVVCQPGSLRYALRSIASARRDGFKLRPSQRTTKLSPRNARLWARLNRAFAKRCRFRDVQAAVNASGNNDRIVVMPGVYTEEPSRRAPTNDPRCEALKNADGSIPYRYQVTCPNDQNLVFVQGRGLSETAAPDPPREDRHGIPDAGPCVRCNLQIEGSGPKAEDVILDAAKEPGRENLFKGVTREQTAKDVAMRADRADGLVVRRMTFARAAEHGLYVHETDGYLLDQVKFFYSRSYGALLFTSDHGVTQNCEGAGHGDSAVYPGAAAETGEAARRDFYPDAPRLNQVVRRCDLHHNLIGASAGSMGNAVNIADNEIYDNASGISTDSFFAGGHPGYPQDSGVYEGNNIYSNNFNPFEEGSDVEPVTIAVVGTGMFIAGGNANQFRNNRVYDNWRRGLMLFAVPDAVVGEDEGTPSSTSFNNRIVGNKMGIAPDGSAKPNGLDFWWDEFPGNSGNRWCANDGLGSGPTSDPPPALLPGCQGPSLGAGSPLKEAEAVVCGGVVLTGNTGDPKCPWFTTPPRPGREDARAQARRNEALLGDSPAAAQLIGGICDVFGMSTLRCKPFLERLGPA